MKASITAIFLGFALTIAPVSASTIDQSDPLLCSISKLNECLPNGVCEPVTAESIKAPDFLRVDFKKRQVSDVALGIEDRVPSEVASIQELDGKIYLMGVDAGIEGVQEGLAWSMSVDQKNGKMVLSASGDAVAFVIFGACMPL